MADFLDSILLGVVAGVIASAIYLAVGWAHAAYVEWRKPLTILSRFGGPAKSKSLSQRSASGTFILFFDVRNNTQQFLSVRIYPRPGGEFVLEPNPIHEVGSSRTFGLQDIRLQPREFLSLFLLLKASRSVAQFSLHFETARWGFRYPALSNSDKVDLVVG